MPIKQRAVVRHWSVYNGEREVEPSFSGPHIADIARPFLGCRIRMEASIQKVGAMLKAWLLSVAALNFLLPAFKVSGASERLRRAALRCTD